MKIMKAKLIVYNLSNLNHYQKVLVNRALFGYNDHSNKGKYFYKREGILKKMPHLRLSKGVLIVKVRDQKKVLDILKKYKAKYFVFTINTKGLKLY